MTPEFSRRLPVERIGPAGHNLTIEAAASELAGVAARLHLTTISALTCRYHLRPAQGFRFVAEGWLNSVLTQSCVLSLDEFAAPVSDHFVVHFVPAGSERDDIDPDSADEIPYSDGVIDLGEATVEQLALVLDPWPRKPDAVEPTVAPDEPSSPFAALRQKHLPV